jgi:restriction endonuclease XhoI-like protein
LVAVVEVKSQVRSFGNNFNNRVEEALGNATDFWAAYREGIFSPSQKPWIGYLFMLEEREASIRATKPITLKPYKVDEAFQRRSYAKRYELVCERLVRDRLYDAACFFTSNAQTGKRGEYKEPSQELSTKISPFPYTLELPRLHGWARRSKCSKVTTKSESGEVDRTGLRHTMVKRMHYI